MSVDLCYILNQGPIAVIFLPLLEDIDLITLKICSKEFNQHPDLCKEIENRVLNDYFNFVPKYYSFTKIFESLDLETQEKIMHIFQNVSMKNSRLQQLFSLISPQLRKENVRIGDIIVYDYNKFLTNNHGYIFTKQTLVCLRFCDSENNPTTSVSLNLFSPNTYRCRCENKCFVETTYRDVSHIEQIDRNFNPETKTSSLEIKLRYGVKVNFNVKIDYKIGLSSSMTINIIGYEHDTKTIIMEELYHKIFKLSLDN